MALLTTYSDWATVFERFAKGDDTLFEQMNSGRFMLDAGTAQRFYSRAEEAYQARKTIWLHSFQHSLHMQAIKTDNDWGIALRNGKQNLSPLVKFVSAKGLPAALRDVLYKDLCGFVAEIKKSLNDNLPKTGSGRQRILIMLNAFGMPEERHDENITGAIQIEKGEGSPTGRKIIFNHGEQNRI